MDKPKIMCILGWRESTQWHRAAVPKRGLQHTNNMERTVLCQDLVHSRLPQSILASVDAPMAPAVPANTSPVHIRTMQTSTLGRTGRFVE